MILEMLESNSKFGNFGSPRCLVLLCGLRTPLLPCFWKPFARVVALLHGGAEHPEQGSLCSAHPIHCTAHKLIPRIGHWPYWQWQLPADFQYLMYHET